MRDWSPGQEVYIDMKKLVKRMNSVEKRLEVIEETFRKISEIGKE